MFLIKFHNSKFYCIVSIHESFNLKSTLTAGENIISTTKIRNNYGAIQSFIFRYCDSNIGLFFMFLVKLSLLILFASFLVLVHCFFLDGSLSLSCRSFSLLQAIAKILTLLFANALKRVKER